MPQLSLSIATMNPIILSEFTPSVYLLLIPQILNSHDEHAETDSKGKLPDLIVKPESIY